MKTAITSSLNNLSASRIKRVALEGSWLVAGQVATIVGTLALVRVLTQYLSPAQYGQLALVLTVHALINQLITGGLSGGITRFYSIALEENDIQNYIIASVKLFLNAIIFSFLLGAVVLAYLFYLNEQQYVLQIAAVVIFSILNGISITLNGILNIIRKRAAVAIHTAAEAWLRIAIIIALLYFFRPSVFAVVAAYSFASLIVVVSQFFLLKKALAAQLSKTTLNSQQDWARNIWKFTMPFSLWGLFTWGQQASDRWAMEHFSTTFDVGQYVVVYQLGFVPVGIITSVVLSYLIPIFYQRYGSGKDVILTASVHRLTKIITALCLIATAVGFLITFFLHEWLFNLLVAKSFRSASRFLPWVVLAGGFFAAGQLLSLKFLSELRSSVMIVQKIATAVVGIMLNIYGAWRFGIAGVVGGLVTFSFLYFISTAFLITRPAPSAITAKGSFRK